MDDLEMKNEINDFVDRAKKLSDSCAVIMCGEALPVGLLAAEILRLTLRTAAPKTVTDIVDEMIEPLKSPDAQREIFNSAIKTAVENDLTANGLNGKEQPNVEK